eukprot:7387442-Prymnesium_polylepis.1
MLIHVLEAPLSGETLEYRPPGAPQAIDRPCAHPCIITAGYTGAPGSRCAGRTSPSHTESRAVVRPLIWRRPQRLRRAYTLLPPGRLLLMAPAREGERHPAWRTRHERLGAQQ